MLNKLKLIVNIPFLVCLIILLLNDFYLKVEYHNWLTGKLSDFSGLFVFVSLWTALFSNKKQTIYFSTILLFVIWKSPYSQSFVDFFSYNFYPIHRVVDITDLIALTVLPIAFCYKPDFNLNINPIPLALLTLFSFCATSIPKPTQVFEQPQYLLFKSGNTAFEHSNYPNIYEVYNLDSLVIVDVRSIRINKRAAIDDDFHRVQILKDVDLRLLREVTGGYGTRRSLIQYEGLKDSLIAVEAMSITLKLDSITDELNFRKTRLDGDFKRYADNNRLIIEGEYKNGIEDSIWIFYNYHGDILSKKYFDNGELIKIEQFENSKFISEQKFDTRAETIRNKYFHLAIILTLIIGLIMKICFDFKRSKHKSIIEISNFLKVSGSMILPIGTLMLTKWFSSLISNSYAPLFLELFWGSILTYVMTVPVFLLIFYLLKLRNWFDLIYYALLLSLFIVLIEELIYLKSIL